MKAESSRLYRTEKARKGLRGRCECGATVTTEGGEKLMRVPVSNGKFPSSSLAALQGDCPACKAKGSVIFR